MGRNEEKYRQMEARCVERMKAIEAVGCGTIGPGVNIDLANQSNFETAAFMLSRIADALEEMNENIKNLAADRNTNPAHADDGK